MSRQPRDRPRNPQTDVGYEALEPLRRRYANRLTARRRDGQVGGDRSASSPRWRRGQCPSFLAADDSPRPLIRSPRGRSTCELRLAKAHLVRSVRAALEELGVLSSASADLARMNDALIASLVQLSLVDLAPRVSDSAAIGDSPPLSMRTGRIRRLANSLLISSRSTRRNVARRARQRGSPRKAAFDALPGVRKALRPSRRARRQLAAPPREPARAAPERPGLSFGA